MNRTDLESSHEKSTVVSRPQTQVLSSKLDVGVKNKPRSSHFEYLLTAVSWRRNKQGMSSKSRCGGRQEGHILRRCGERKREPKARVESSSCCCSMRRALLHSERGGSSKSDRWAWGWVGAFGKRPHLCKGGGSGGYAELGLRGGLVRRPLRRNKPNGWLGGRGKGGSRIRRMVGAHGAPFRLENASLPVWKRTYHSQSPGVNRVDLLKALEAIRFKNRVHI